MRIQLLNSHQHSQADHLVARFRQLRGAGDFNTIVIFG